MSRPPRESDFHVDVEGIGRFCFARRSMGDTFKIRGRYNQLTDGNYDEMGNMADLPAVAWVTIQTLLVDAPEGFSLDSLDPVLVDINQIDRDLIKIWVALSEKERSFRPRPKAPSEGTRPSDGVGAGAVVPQDVPAGSDRPEVSGGDA